MPFEETTDIDQLHVESPAYDYVPPELVSLFVTNVYALAPSITTYQQITDNR
jgi:translation initiation factor 2B subunit (eIF-2B alpha/beta/delta family)